MRFDLLSLRIFQTVVEEGNLTKAAEREHMAVSAASKRIQNLEHDVGVRLLHRTVKGAAPTAAGTALARRCRALFDLIGTMRAELDDYASGQLGEVIVHANGSAIVEYLAGDLRAFLTERPAVKLSLHENVSPEVLRAVSNGLADFGVFANTMALPPNLTVYPYRRDRVVAVVPRGHSLANRESVAFAELLDHDQICSNEAHSLTALQLREAERLGRTLRFAYTVRTNEVARWMVHTGLGIVMLPEGFAVPYERSLAVRVIPVADPWALRDLSIAVRDPDGLTGAARLLLEWLRRNADKDIRPDWHPGPPFPSGEYGATD
ncbi:LysR substrate-binding domain-containing protein [Marinivivus vitaminiproducens]|uniref:LysR substrate-binding domain-containing protein n=1 Tax=Marinivivus vitaminiproducens TaxID=3035935 RepID=UPI0027A2F4E3|nr:LysR substrate-binding domain-containing protein [Geminicoccaceae bacterium SCSIO 64248]